jgi:hypothetical protein
MPPFVLRSLRWTVLSLVGFSVVTGGWPCDFSVPFTAALADDKSDASERQALRQELRRRSEETEVYEIRGGAQVAGQWVAEPLFRYSDQPRDILDAAVWTWLVDGRPIAFQKVEAYRDGPTNSKRIYCLTSLSPGRISAEWPNRRRWSAQKPGAVFQPIPEGGAVADSPTGRLLQMKKFARRFTATMVDEPVDNRQEMRLLPQPIFRYSHPQTGLIDGAVFGFASNGTNPDALLIIELQQPENKADAAASEVGSNSPTIGEWRYAVTGMTQGGLSVKFNDREVWSKTYERGPAEFENWLWFRNDAEPED